MKTFIGKMKTAKKKKVYC